MVCFDVGLLFLNKRLFCDDYISIFNMYEYKTNTWFSESCSIGIASTEDIGTPRVRANHNDALIDYCLEQENLKKINAPIWMWHFRDWRDILTQ